MNIESISLLPIAEAFRELSSLVIEDWEGSEEPSPELVSKAMVQLLEVLEENTGESRHPNQLSQDEMDELGEYGLALIQEMAAFAIDLGMRETAEQIEDLSFPFAVWLSRNNCEIENITPVVNALARRAHQISESLQLKQLYSYITEITDCLSPAVTQEIEETDSRHPWRILVINQALIATRSHDLKLIENAFEMLVEALPAEAARFFEESVEQMHIINYPDTVKDMLQRYYLMHGTGRTIH